MTGNHPMNADDAETYVGSRFEQLRAAVAHGDPDAASRIVDQADADGHPDAAAVMDAGLARTSLGPQLAEPDGRGCAAAGCTSRRSSAQSDAALYRGAWRAAAEARAGYPLDTSDEEWARLADMWMGPAERAMVDFAYRAGLRADCADGPDTQDTE